MYFYYKLADIWWAYLFDWHYLVSSYNQRVHGFSDTANCTSISIVLRVTEAVLQLLVRLKAGRGGLSVTAAADRRLDVLIGG